MQAPNAVPEADWSRRSTSSWLSHAPPLLVWTAGSARTQWTRGPPHSLAHRGRRCLRSHASAGIKSNVCVTALTSSARIRGAVRRLRRTALGDTASVLVFIVLVFKREAPVRVHAVLPLAHSASRTRARLATRSSARSGQSWRPSPALPSTCSKRSRRIGHSSAPRRDAAIVHRRTGDLSLRLRRQRRRRPPRRRPPRCPVRAAASSRGERG